MKRRSFLAGLSALPAASQVVKPDRPLHPRVQLAIDDLLAVTAELKISASKTNLVITADSGLQPDEWELEIQPDKIAVRGDDRGITYALAHLRRIILLDRAIPSSLSIRRSPHFKVRRWSTAVSHDFGSPWDDRIHLAERFAFIKSEVIRRAPDYGINSIEINGRPGDGWDIDWIISFEKYPELAGLYPAGERKRRLELVEDLAQFAKQNLLDFVVWSHELHLPPGFPELYPQIAGTDYPVCLSNEFLKQFIRDKYIEFFGACPSVDGVVLSVNESGQFSLITDAGCRCNRCIRLSQHERLMSILNPVIEVAGKLNKNVVLRTFQSAWIRDLRSHPELETIRRAYTGLPPQVEIMSKYCPLDFYGAEIADEPLIGAFPNPHLVEFSLDVEWQGRTFVPALTPENFRKRIAHAVEKNCSGIVARVDFPFPTMEPGAIFGHPNEFNAWYMAELLWDPKTGITDSLDRWSRMRYGDKAAAVLGPALIKTEEITQKTFFCLGETLINYHNMIASVSFSDDGLWSRALSKWDPSKRKLSESFFNPDNDLLDAALREKAAAVQSAMQALTETRSAKGLLPEPEFERMRAWFEKLRDSAQLWGHLTELYLRHRQIAFSPAIPDRIQHALAEPAGLNRLLETAGLAVRKAVEMEHRHGSNSWPVVSPDRGVTAYEFVHDVLRNYISGLTGEPARTSVQWQYGDSVVTNPLVDAGSIESFWRKLVEAGRPRVAIENSETFALHWPGRLKRIRFSGRIVTLDAADGKTIALPVPYPVREISLDQKATTLRVRKRVHDLSVEPV